MNNQELISLAYAARKNAYTPYSHFQVGAALLTAEGKVYGGCNIENAAYGAVNCAERTAFFKAISEGERHFQKIAIVGGREGGETTHQVCFPCGICRQVMQEFCDPETFEIVLEDGAGKTRSYLLKELLPYGFEKTDLSI